MVAIRSTAAAVGLPGRAAVVSPAPGIPACTATWKSAAASARLGDSGIRNRSHHCVGSLRRACLGPLAEGRPQLSRRWRGPDHHHRREHTRHHDNRSQHDIPDDHTRRELPAGASACPGGQPAGSYKESATSGGKTSCEFAEAVRIAYGNSGATGASSTVSARSPVTGKEYTMACKVTSGIVTCTGGDNAVVYLR
ncbi:hypothetical protein [Rhodococcus erythropolis]|uniref:hypothetical protein n=1 Tax=Rhodococcus erythropolis TaxID=1833 RepID=UPI0036D78117